MNDYKIAPGSLGVNLNAVLKSSDDAAQDEIFGDQIGGSSQLDHGDHVWFGPKIENGYLDWTWTGCIFSWLFIIFYVDVLMHRTTF